MQTYASGGKSGLGLAPRICGACSEELVLPWGAGTCEYLLPESLDSDLDW